LRMVLAAGAATAGMGGFYGHVQSRDALTNPKLWPYPTPDMPLSGGIVVDSRGQRFCDEGLSGFPVANVLANRDDPPEAFVASDAQVRDVRQRATALVRQETKTAYADVNYVFPNFVIEHMPIGLVGLIIAAIFAAAMSSIAAELNSLATATVIDVYRRHLKPTAEDSHYLLVSKLATAGWGAFACVAALYAAQLGSLIEVVNRFGSYFYGSLLGVFILALGFKRANGHGAFFGLLGGLATVALVAQWNGPDRVHMSFLWYNVIGAFAVALIGAIVSAMTGGNSRLIRELTKRVGDENIRTGMKVTVIVQRSDVVTVKAGSESFRADACICTCSPRPKVWKW